MSSSHKLVNWLMMLYMNDHLTILFKVYVFLYVDGKSKMTSTLDKGFNTGKCINIFISETIKLTQPIIPIDDYLMVMNKVFCFMSIRKSKMGAINDCFQYVSVTIIKKHVICSSRKLLNWLYPKLSRNDSWMVLFDF